MNVSTRHVVLSLLAIVSASGLAAGDVIVDSMFSDHMVLQRQMVVPVWGRGDPGETVTVSFRGQTKRTRIDKNGKWLLRLDAMKVAEPGKLTVTGAAGRPIVFDDVVVGEVWFGSGQSNMAHTAKFLSKTDPGLAKILAGGPYPNLRVYRDGWKRGDGESVGRFSGLLLAFGLPLQERLDVPVGLIYGAVWGSAEGRWVTPEMIEADDVCRKLIKAAGVDVTDPASNAKWFAGEMAGYEKALAAAKRGERRMPYKPNRQLARGDLYTRRVLPVIPYAIRGVLWDQGESGTAIDALDQHVLTGALIRGWRKAWGQGAFPLLYIQKPSGGGCAWDYADPVTCKADRFEPLPAEANAADAGACRAMHIRIMSYPNTAMVTASDLGSGVHPVNKVGYGLRACRVAMGFVYGRDVETYGPIFKAADVEGGAIRVRFSHGAGLACPPGQTLQGFEIAGADGAYHWADAKIVGQSVLVASDKVPAPVFVRYGWAQSHPWANLFNGAHLPALTFKARAGKAEP